MNSINLKARILIPLFIIFTLLLIAGAGNLIHEGNKQIDREFLYTSNNIQQFYQTAFEKTAEKMMGVIEVLIKDPKLQDALKSSDRAKLLSLTSSLFDRIKIKYSITHFYFHDLQGINLLRVHQPERYGDTINRFTLIEAKQSGETAYGSELGPLGTFTLRVVTPVRQRGQLLGYIELGEEISPIINDMTSMFGIELFSLINKKYLVQAEWEAGMRMLNYPADWDDFESAVIVSKAHPYRSKDLNLLLQQMSSEPELTSYPFLYDGYNYRAGTIPHHDAGNRKVGKLLFLRDMTIPLHQNHMLIIYMTGGILLFSTLLFAFFYWLLGRIERKLNASHQDLVESEACLNRSMQRIQLHYERTPLGVIEWNKDFEVVEWNPAAENIFGYTKEEALGRHACELIVPKEIEEPIDEVWQTLMAKNEVSHQVNENTTKDGQVLICEWYNTPLLDQDGKVTGVASLVENITEKRKAEQALQNHEQELRQILECMIDGILTVDIKGTILTINHAAETIFGYDSEEIIGQSINILIPEQFRPHHDAHLAHFTSQTTASDLKDNPNLQGQNKDGKTFPLRIAIAKLPNDAEGNGRFIATCTDISKQKQQEELLRHSQKMDALGKLTGGIAHDFNNLLGVIIGYTEILELQLFDKPALFDCIKEIENASERGQKLTQNLLSFSRRKTTNTESININQVIEDDRAMLSQTLTPSIELQLEPGNNLWPVMLDKHDLENALLNMTINAMHAMPKGGKLTISTKNETLTDIDCNKLGLNPGQYVQLSITDTGTGMDKETQQKIFDPFFSTKANLGTGLGLSQVYGFVQQAKGSIQVYSELDMGSRFIFYFPRHVVEDADSPEKDTKETNLEFTAKGNETILIVDDEPALAKVAEKILQSSGYQTFCVENGNAALNILEEHPVDLVFSDVIMPEMNGYTLANIIREKYPQIKIQLTSGFNDQTHETLSDKQLHEQLLQKPVRSKELLQRIRSLFDEND